MKLSAEHLVPLPRDKVFALLADPTRMRRAIDGCERMIETSPGVFEVLLKLGVAGLKGSYQGKIRRVAQEPPATLTLEVEGKGAPGFVRGTATIVLEEASGGTRMKVDGDASVGGMIAAVGSRLIEAAGKKMLADFTAKLPGLDA